MEARITFLSAILLALIVGLFTPGCTPVHPSETRVSVVSLSNDNGYGSGVVLAPGLVLTAAHVAVESPLSIAKDGAAGVTIAKGEGKLDVALMAFPPTQARCPCAKLAEYDAKLDEPVYVVGYPMGVAQVLTRGDSQGVHDNVSIVGAWGIEIRLGRRLVMTAGAAGGNSGGGVFVYRDGEFQLVGILVEGVQNITFAVPISDIRSFLKEAGYA